MVLVLVLFSYFVCVIVLERERERNSVGVFWVVVDGYSWLAMVDDWIVVFLL